MDQVNPISGDQDMWRNGTHVLPRGGKFIHGWVQSHLGSHLLHPWHHQNGPWFKW